MSLNANAQPSTNFDLSDWKLQLPIDAKSGFNGKASEVKSLSGYEHDDYFYTGPDGAMVLAAPVEGATTGGSIYARSELREMNGSSPAAWTLGQGGQLASTLQVDNAPAQSDGTYGKVVVGQVHGGDGQLVRLAWEDGTLFYANDITSNGQKDVHIELLNKDGEQPSVSLNETFSYKIDVSSDQLTVSVAADGDIYSSAAAIHKDWSDNAFYFKSGAYLGVNESTGRGYAQVSLFGLDLDHSGSDTVIAAPKPPASEVPTSPPVGDAPGSAPEVREVAQTITGSDAEDALRGTSDNDMLIGGKGNDQLNGIFGHDVLVGGAGDDVFVFDRNASTKGNSDVIVDFTAANDTLALSSEKLESLQDGVTSANLFFGEYAQDENDYILYDKTSGELLYDRDGSGNRSAQVIAVLENRPVLTVEDFDIF